jgi:predicted nuclease of predicted toxin-antitoxin system
MAAADDKDIWAYAIQVGAVIVTKDEDFAERRARAVDGPSIVWIRIGTCTDMAALGYPLGPAAADRHALWRPWP